jgi:peptidylprolyl isomerase
MSNTKAFLSVCSAVALLLFSAPSAFSAEKEKAVKAGDTVEIHYTGKLQDNTVFDTSGKETIKFQVGSDEIIKGLSDGMVGMHAGQKKTIEIKPAEAYGDYDDKMIFTVPLKNLPKGVKKGEHLVNPQGMPVEVKDIQGENAVLDGNHPLAGKTLIFEVELVKVS